jgi:DNA-binding NtrC family response regulator
MVLEGDREVVLAASVDEALGALARTPPDLVLLDLVMPGRSGFELPEELADAPGAARVVVLTGTTSVSTAVEAMKQGAADHLTKPFEVEALRIKVRQHLERRHPLAGRPGRACLRSPGALHLRWLAARAAFGGACGGGPVRR